MLTLAFTRRIDGFGAGSPIVASNNIQSVAHMGSEDFEQVGFRGFCITTDN